jgi:hypothetical protein
VGGWGVEQLGLAEQGDADRAVAELLGISRGHAILLRQINDKVDGAPSIVLTAPEKVLGEHAQLVLKFFKYLDSMTVFDWRSYDAARDAAWAAARDAAWAAARDAAWAAAGAAAGAANEIQGYKILAAKGTPLFFLPMLGFNTIEDLADWSNRQ